MFKKLIKLKTILVISLFLITNSAYTISSIDSTNRSDNLKAFEWEVIDFPNNEQKLLIENPEHIPFLSKEMSKNSIKKLEEANMFYSKGVDLMKSRDYTGAIEKFTLARKSYKRAKITEHDYNYININQALCYASSGKEKDFAVASRYISLVTSKIEKEKEWLYNLAIANNMIQQDHKKECVYRKAAISNLTLAIRLDENYFQAYITLEKIHRNQNNKSNADKVRDRMETAEARLIKKEQRNSKNGKTDNNKISQESFSIEGVKPEVTQLNIVKDDDNLQFNKVSQIKERSMPIVQEGVGSYNNGVDALSNKNYERAIEELKIAEKKLKRGKIKENGLNFSRAQLSIAYLCTGEKNKLGQVKRNLRNISNKLYETRDWTYNMAVVNYDYGKKILVRLEKDNDKWIAKAKKSEFLKDAIKLFKLTIKHDKLYLNPYQNLVYLYKEIGDLNKAEKYQKLYNKRRDELIRSFDREKQIQMGLANEYVFRVNLGTYGEYEAPADMFDEEYLITVPINERQTAYLAGMYFSLDDAIVYQKEMIKKGYTDAFIAAFKDGDKIDF